MWGCAAYYRHYKHGDIRPKLDSRATLGYCVGHNHSHGYLIWVPEKGRVDLRTHVSFVETRNRPEEVEGRTLYELPESSSSESDTSSGGDDESDDDSDDEHPSVGQRGKRPRRQESPPSPWVPSRPARWQPLAAVVPRRSERLRSHDSSEPTERQLTEEPNEEPDQPDIRPQRPRAPRPRRFHDVFNTGRPDNALFHPTREQPAKAKPTGEKASTEQTTRELPVRQQPIRDQLESEPRQNPVADHESQLESIASYEHPQHAFERRNREEGSSQAVTRGQFYNRESSSRSTSPSINHLIALGADIAPQGDPDTFKAAMNGPQAEHWYKAMKEEVDSLLENNVWTEMKSPTYANILQGRWVYRRKINADGTIAKYKARWVAKGFNQVYGVDYDETFASLVKPMSYRPLFAIAAQEDWEIHQMDVRTAFLNAPLDEEVYVQKPTGYDGIRADDFQLAKVDEALTPRNVCRLNRALYGLKQAPRAWYLTLKYFLVTQGMQPMDSDQAAFKKASGPPDLFLAVYVDDILLFGPSKPALNTMKAALKTRFSMTDLGECGTFLGLQVSRNRTSRTLMLTQTPYVDEIIQRFDLAGQIPKSTPMEKSRQYTLVPSEAQSSLADTRHYQAMLGSLMYLVVETRPDIAYAVGLLSRFAKNPNSTHLAALKRVFAYLLTTRNLGPVYRRKGFLIGYADADYGMDQDTRKSTTGWVFQIGGAPISWASQRQKCTAQSTCEAELIAASEAVREAIWLRKLVLELQMPQLFGLSTSVMLMGDNQATHALAKDERYHNRAKHIDVRYYLIREHIGRKTVDYRWASSGDILADGLTKPLPEPAFLAFVRDLGMGTSA